MESNNNHVANPLSIERVEDSERQPERSASEIFFQQLSEYDVTKDKFWWTPLGLGRRWFYRLWLLISDHYVTVSYIDSVVNIFALVNALYLTVPVAAITATK